MYIWADLFPITRPHRLGPLDQRCHSTVYSTLVVVLVLCGYQLVRLWNFLCCCWVFSLGHQSTSRPVWAARAFILFLLLLLLSAGYCYCYCYCWVSSLGHPLWTHQSTSRPVWAVGKAFTLFLSEEQLKILAAESNTFRVMQQISDESDDSWQCGIPVSVGMILFLVLTR